MTSIGETLRRERLRRNLNLEQIARQTKIAPRLLQAIEDEHFDKLPGGVFTKSFVRQYARVLGLDEEEFVGELQRVLEPPAEVATAGEEASEAPVRIPRVPVFEGGVTHTRSASSLPAFALVVAVMLLCSAVYAWWQRSRRPAPVETAEVTQPVPAPAVSETSPGPAPPASAPAPDKPANTSTQIPTASSASRLDTGAPVQPASLQSPAVLGTPGGPVQVGLNANDVTWVKVWSDGKPVFEGTLRPNQAQAVNATGKIRIRVGNAGGLDATLNGKPVGPLGRKGQISVVQFTPEGAHVIPITPYEDEESDAEPVERREPAKVKPAPKPKADPDANRVEEPEGQPAPPADRAHNSGQAT